jgi:hypothetical protein
MVATATRPADQGQKYAPTPTPADLPKFASLLRECLDEPGTIHAAYSAFHDFSLGNQLSALLQCRVRGIAPGPLASYGAWIKRGRQVRKGEHALWLWMPLTIRGKQGDQTDDGEPVVPGMVTIFVQKPRWFVLSQTDGADYTPPPPPDWDGDKACAALGVARVNFDDTRGNVMGYANGHGEVAVSPLAFDPTKTLAHELAHVVLGHVKRDPDAPDSRALAEVEAEAAAYIVGAILGLQSAAFSRGYVQHWLARSGKADMPEASAKRVFSAAQKILAAGRASKPSDDSAS